MQAPDNSKHISTAAVIVVETNLLLHNYGFSQNMGNIFGKTIQDYWYISRSHSYNEIFTLLCPFTAVSTFDWRPNCVISVQELKCAKLNVETTIITFINDSTYVTPNLQIIVQTNHNNTLGSIQNMDSRSGVSRSNFHSSMGPKMTRLQ